MGLFSTISFATRGRIIPSSVRKALALATIGWILVGGVPPPSTGSKPYERAKEIVGGRYNQDQELIDILMKEDDEVLNIIKTWVKFQ
jgi:hypothetical protein